MESPNYKGTLFNFVSGFRSFLDKSPFIIKVDFIVFSGDWIDCDRVGGKVIKLTGVSVSFSQERPGGNASRLQIVRNIPYPTGNR